jgi:hypothetical protein
MAAGTAAIAVLLTDFTCERADVIDNRAPDSRIFDTNEGAVQFQTVAGIQKMDNNVFRRTFGNATAVRTGLLV